MPLSGCTREPRESQGQWRLVGSQASVAIHRSVAHPAQLWQRLTIRRTVRNLPRADDVVQCPQNRRARGARLVIAGALHPI
jgi:hypothetical protein